MIEQLAPAFTIADAEKRGVSKDQLYRLLSEGVIERSARGIYIRPETIDPTLAPLAAATAGRLSSTLCLTSALTFHGLMDAIPFGCDIALPRGTRTIAGIEHAIWHTFDVATFTIGREPLPNDSGLDLYTYSPERCIIDTFRLAHQEGQDTATLTLKRWLEKKGNSPSTLLDMAKSFPKAEPSLRKTLEILL